MHVSSNHRQITCDNCHVTIDTLIDAASHTCHLHNNTVENQEESESVSINTVDESLFTCEACESNSKNQDEVKQHKEKTHVDNNVLQQVVSSQSELGNDFGIFKNDMLSLMKSILNDNTAIKHELNEVKQELFILRQDKRKIDEKLEKIVHSVNDFNKMQSTVITSGFSDPIPTQKIA